MTEGLKCNMEQSIHGSIFSVIIGVYLLCLGLHWECYWVLCSHRSSHALQFVLIFLTINKIHGCFITQHPLWPVDLSFWLPYSHHSAPFPSAAPIPLPVSEMVLSCGSLHRGSAYWALAMWKQRAGSSGPNGVAVTVEESFTAPDRSKCKSQVSSVLGET